MNIEKSIRKLARTSYWQRIYDYSSKHNGINIFDNNNNFSGLQILFLYWLNIYNMLYTELIEKEWDNLDEKIIEDDFRCDSFLIWRSNNIEKRRTDIKKEEKKHNNSNKSFKNMAGKSSFNIYKGAKGNK